MRKTDKTKRTVKLQSQKKDLVYYRSSKNLSGPKRRAISDRNRSLTLKSKLNSVRIRLFELGRIPLVIVVLLLVTYIPKIETTCNTVSNSSCKNTTSYNKILDDRTNLLSKFRPTLSTDRIEAALIASPSVVSVSSQIGLFNIYKIKIIESEGSVLWQSNQPGIDRYVIDLRGVAIEKLAADKELESVAVVVDSSPVRPLVGDLLVDPSIIEAVLTVTGDSSLITDHSFIRAEIGSSPREYTLLISSEKTKKQIRVVLTTQRPLEHQLLDINMSLDYLVGKGKNFSSLDVRLSSAISYK